MCRSSLILIHHIVRSHCARSYESRTRSAVSKIALVRDASDISFLKRIRQYRVKRIDVVFRQRSAVENGILRKFVKRSLVKEIIAAGCKQRSSSEYCNYLFHIIIRLESQFHAGIENTQLRIGLIRFIAGFRIDVLQSGKCQQVIAGDIES